MELMACNPIYANLHNALVAKPRWLRTDEELRTTSRSSLVFALTDESLAKQIIKQRFLAAHGRHCSVRAFQDRPPVTQCRNCWRLDHSTHKCKEEKRCRICSGLHDEKDHPFSNPNDCPKCRLFAEMGDSMDTSNEGQCPHDMRCLNCLGNQDKEHNHPADARRCPSRLEKYGTARENERQARKSDNPWTKVKSRKMKPKTPAQASSSASSNTANRFEAIDPEPHTNATTSTSTTITATPTIPTATPNLPSFIS